MLRKILRFVPFAIPVLVGAALVGVPSVSQEKNASGFKNVQVLTEMTRDELDEFMDTMVEYVGAEKCAYCHVQDKSSDELEHKVTARRFIKMTKELNETVFKDGEKKVTCYTCHRGKQLPFNTPEEEEAAAKK